jgi:hypothetical protein
MKMSLKVIVSATGVAALLGFPLTTMAQPRQLVFPPPTTPPPGTVTAITTTPLSNNVVFTDVGHGLTVVTICRDGGQPNSLVAMAFHNSGSDRATLNFLFSDGTTVTANGLVLQPLFGEFQANFNNKRIEGQFIFANGAGNTTVSLHAFDGGTFCEVRGTVQFGPNPLQVLPPIASGAQ